MARPIEARAGAAALCALGLTIGWCETRAAEELGPPEFEAGEVIIESEPLLDQLTPEEISRRFREVLGGPFSPIYVERDLANGAVETSTRFGKFCIPPTPEHMRPNLGEGVTLANRCVQY